MNGERDIKTHQIKKCKARKMDFSIMNKVRHYSKLYSPVLVCSSVRILLILVALDVWNTMQVDYAQTFPRLLIEKDLYLNIPKGFQVEYGYEDDYLLKLHRNIYDQEQTGSVWYKYLTKNLTKNLGLTKSDINEFVFYGGQ